MVIWLLESADALNAAQHGMIRYYTDDACLKVRHTNIIPWLSGQQEGKTVLTFQPFGFFMD